jgi:hypothetical protein
MREVTTVIDRIRLQGGARRVADNGDDAAHRVDSELRVADHQVNACRILL